MLYLMTQNVFAPGEPLYVRDELGRCAFVIDRTLFQFVRRVSFQDMHRREVAYIREKLMAGGPAFEIYYADELQAVVKKAIPDPHCTFSTDAPGPDDLRACGDFSEHEYAFTRDGRTVARVSKSFFAQRNAYGVEIDKTEDEVLVLASTIVLDTCCNGHGRESD